VNSEVKTCQNCKARFTIEPDDFAFYKKMEVPPPTFCPDCRLQRRLIYMHNFQVYKRACDLCKKEVMSVYAPDADCVAYCPACWWSDNWDPMQYGREYDFSRPFFEQFGELSRRVPVRGLLVDLRTFATAPYNNYDGHLKNCYLLFFTDDNDDCAYGTYMRDVKWSLDSSFIMQSENCYDCMHTFKVSGGIGFRSHVTESVNCAFLKDSSNCQNCFASANLRGKKYVAFNKQYSKEEYQKFIAQWDLGSYREYRTVQQLAEAHWKTLPPKPIFDDLSVNYTGDNIFESKNVKDSYEVVGAEDSRFVLLMKTAPVRDAYDHSEWGNNSNRTYECVTVGDHAADICFSQDCGEGTRDARYCKLALGCSNVFGCVGVRKKQYCILNKQYTEKEYNELIPKIRKHMDEMPYTDKRGCVYRYGEFFPPKLCPFAYNEAIVQSFFPLTKETAVERGFAWRDIARKEYAITLKAADLPDHIKDAPDSILNEVIGCDSCGRGFRMIPFELDFLRAKRLPLPRSCPFCRITAKFDIWVKGFRQNDRTCSTCGAQFKTRYTPEEAPVILCKQCYLAEVA
jgi:hypothetical protein